MIRSHLVECLTAFQVVETIFKLVIAIYCSLLTGGGIQK